MCHREAQPERHVTEPELQSLCSARRDAAAAGRACAAAREPSTLATTRKKPTRQRGPSTARKGIRGGFIK